MNRTQLKERAQKLGPQINRPARSVKQADEGAARRGAIKRLKRAQRKQRRFEVLVAGGHSAMKAAAAKES